MSKRYERVIGALSGEEFAALQKKKVCVIGCGGLGGYVVEELVRVGVGGITVVDGDCFEESNLNRQLFSSVNKLGKNKALAAKERAGAVNPDVSVHAVQAFFQKENAGEILAGHDVAVDALDNVQSRLILAQYCGELGIPIVHGAIGPWSAQVTVILPGSCRMEQLYAPNAVVKSKSSLSFVPAICASIQAAETVKLLVGRNSPLKDCLLYMDLNSMDFELIELF